MGVYLVLESTYGSEKEVHKGSHHVTGYINELKRIQFAASTLENNSWTVNVNFVGNEFFITCYPPSELDSIDLLKEQLNDLGINCLDVKYISFEEDDEDDCEIPDYGGNVFMEDSDDEIEEEEKEFELMNNDVAEWLGGRTILSVDVVEDYRVIFHLAGSKKLIYDEDDYGFFLK